MTNQPLYTEAGLTADGFNHYADKARRMTIPELRYAMQDCSQCVTQGLNSGRYSDESSCYSQELQRRAKKDQARKTRYQVMLDCGLVRVKGSLGGTYYE